MIRIVSLILVSLSETSWFIRKMQGPAKNIGMSTLVVVQQDKIAE
jgi:hypothetical protein